METYFEPRGFTHAETADLATLRHAHELTCQYVMALVALPALQSSIADDLDGTPGYAALEAVGIRELLEDSIARIEALPAEDAAEEAQTVTNNIRCGDYWEYDVNREDEWEWRNAL